MIPQLLVEIEDADGPTVRVINPATVDLRRAELVLGGKLTDANEWDLQMALAYFQIADDQNPVASVEDVRAWADKYRLRVLDTRTPPNPTWPAA